jgi:hypothetical protein
MRLLLLSLASESINTANMTYEQKCQELDQRIRSIQMIEPFDCYTQDGIINVERWKNQQIRPLFIGKEGYELGERKESSVTTWLNDTPEDACRASPRTWQTIAYTSFGLQNAFMPFERMPWIHEDDRIIDSLRTIAFINVGKYGAEKTTSWGRLNGLYQQNSHVLHDQIELFQPNVVIGWNTLDFFERDPNFMSRFSGVPRVRQTQGAVDYWVAEGRLFSFANHPAYLRIKQQNFVDSILDTVRASLPELNQKLPTL